MINERQMSDNITTAAYTEPTESAKLTEEVLQNAISLLEEFKQTKCFLPSFGSIVFWELKSIFDNNEVLQIKTQDLDLSDKEINIQKALGTLSLCERIKLGETPYKEYKIPMMGNLIPIIFSLYFNMKVYEFLINNAEVTGLDLGQFNTS